MAINSEVVECDFERQGAIALKIIDILHQYKCDYYMADEIMGRVSSLLKMQAVQSSDTLEL